MGNRLPTRATYQDIVDLPEHLVGEIIGGVLFTFDAIEFPLNSLWRE